MMPSCWQKATKALCVRLDSMGDVLMTGPALRALRDGGRRMVTLLTSSSGREAAALLPEVDDVIVYDPPWMKSTPRRPDDSCDRDAIEEVRRRGFDAAVIFTVYSQNPLPAALACYLAGIPLRLAHCRENPYQLLTDWVPEPEPHQTLRHEVRRQLDLVASVGCRTTDERLAVNVPAGAHERAAEVLDDAGVDCSTCWIALHVGATAPSRCYPSQSFAEAADRLVEETGCQIVFTGSGHEETRVEEIRALMSTASFSVANRLELGGLAALLSTAPLLISNNSGPVHLAAAVGTPVVDLYALTNPQHTPWGVPNRVLFHDVPCKYCYKSVCPEGHHACLRGVGPAAVVEAARELLVEAGSPRRDAGLMGAPLPV